MGDSIQDGSFPIQHETNATSDSRKDTQSGFTLDLDTADSVKVPHPEHPETVFHCKVLNTHWYDKARRRYKIEGKPKRGRTTSDDIKGGEYAEDQFVETVIDWANFHVRQGGALIDFPCNEANKRTLFRKAKTLCDYIIDEVDRVSKERLELESSN